MPKAQIRYEPNELRLLFELSQALEGAAALAPRLERALEIMARHTGMMRGSLIIFEPSDHELLLEGTFGRQSAETRQADCKVGEGLGGMVIESGKPMVLTKAAAEPEFLDKIVTRRLPKAEIAFFGVPILTTEQCVGALSADRLFADSVSLDEDIRLLQILAGIIAQAFKVRKYFHTMHSSVVAENRRLQQMVRGKFHLDNLLGTSSALRTLKEELALLSTASSTVLIHGESGSGKETVAASIHSSSNRSGRPFIKLSCVGMPENMLEAELFGYGYASLDAATSPRKGRLEMAHGGTLFINEVAELSPLLQSKLLRTLETQEFERFGDMQTIQVDVRLLASSSKNLEELVARGLFLQDLYYRLSVFTLHLPPLRERREDIPQLLTHFIEKLAALNNTKMSTISSDALHLLMAYNWPGNLREFESVIERAIIISGSTGAITPSHLPPWVRQSTDAAKSFELNSANLPHTLEDALATLEQRMLTKELQNSAGNMAKAAQLLGISERMMGLRMKKHNLDYRVFRKK